MNIRLPRASKLLVVVVLALVGSMLTSISTPAEATPMTCAAGGACQPGDIGPGGGKVFYSDPAGFLCGPTLQATCNHLEVATNSSSSPWPTQGAPWSYNPPIVRTLSAIGTGYQNTLEIIAQNTQLNPQDNYVSAASLAHSYTGGGFSDWYLPSLDELRKLYDEHSWIGGFLDYWTGSYQEFYYSSTHCCSRVPYYVNFGDGNPGTPGNDNPGYALSAQPIRAFAAPSPSGDLRVYRSALSGVTPPVRGAAPVTGITGLGFTGTVTWSSQRGSLIGNYDSSTVYTATINLTATTGYTLQGITENFFTVQGATSVTNSANSGLISAVFPVTAHYYDGTNGVEDCGTSGTYTIENNHISSNQDCTGIVEIPEGVTEIPTYAFVWRPITELRIPNSINSIGDYALYGDSSLTSLTLGNGISSIGTAAFRSASLRELFIPNSVITIGDEAFSYNTQLETLTIASSVTNLGARTFTQSQSPSIFNYCGSADLISAEITAQPTCTVPSPNAPTGVTATLTGPSSMRVSFSAPVSNSSTPISSYTAIASPGGATKTVYQSSGGSISFTDLNPSTAYSFTVIASNWARTSGASTPSNTITTPDAPGAPTGVTASLSNSTTAIISYNAPITNGGAVITSYRATSMPDGLNQTSSGSGSGTITISGLTPGRVYRFDVVATNIAGDSEPTTSNYIGISFDGTNGTASCGTSGYFTIINKVVIGNTACVGSVEIPLGVESIGVSAFEENSDITSLSISSSVTTIEDNAFYAASGITSLIIPDNVISVGTGSFQSAFNLSNLTLGSGIQSIGEAAFAGTALTSLIIPNNVTTLGQAAFVGISSLETLTIGSGITTISRSAFQNAYSLTSLTIGNSVTTIGDYAFRDAEALTSLTIGNSVTTIGDYAFQNASSLTSLTIGNSVTTIGDYAFRGLTALTSLEIPDTVNSIGQYAFRGLTSLTSLTLGKGVTTIGYMTFAYAENLTTLRIPEEVTSIDEAAFYGAWSLTTLRIPASINSISEDAFYTDGSLSSFYYCGNLDPNNAFQYSGLDSLPFSCQSTTLPGPPTSVTATSTGPTTAEISFVAPMDDGGDFISQYTVTSSPTGVQQTISQRGGGTFQVTSLVAGTSYTFTVTATNSVGKSLASTPSNSISSGPAPQQVSISIPSPRQQSQISDLSVSTGKAGMKTPVLVSGSFIEKIVNIFINGNHAPVENWVQTPNSISFTMPALSAGRYVIQLYNGSAPVLKALNFTVETSDAPQPATTKSPRPVRTPKPLITPTPKPTPSASPTPTKAPIKSKVITIKCVKGKTVKFVKGTNPKCPSGYVKS